MGIEVVFDSHLLKQVFYFCPLHLCKCVDSDPFLLGLHLPLVEVLSLLVIVHQLPFQLLFLELLSVFLSLYIHFSRKLLQFVLFYFV